MKKLLLLATLGAMFMSAMGPVDTRKRVKAKERVVKIEGAVQAPGILIKANQLYTLAEESKEPITIIINSPGGAVFAGLQFINAMELVKKRGVLLNCYVPGMAASMAFQILAHCDNRYALPYSLLLWHPVRIAGLMLLTPKRAENITESLKEIERIMLPKLLQELKISEKEFEFHYLKETMWTAIGLKRISPEFVTVVLDMPIKGALWNVGRMRSNTKPKSTNLDLNKYTLDDKKKKEPKPPQDCTSCHQPHKKDGVIQ
jgi:ATP-dependent Clp protease protease subunit